MHARSTTHAPRHASPHPRARPRPTRALTHLQPSHTHALNLQVRFVSPNLSHTLCKRIGVRPLSFAVREELLQLEEQTQVDSPRLSESEKRTMNQIFGDRRFAQGLTRLWEDQIAREQNYGAWANVPSAESVASILQTYTLAFVQSLHTRLLLVSNGSDVTRQANPGNLQHMVGAGASYLSDSDDEEHKTPAKDENGNEYTQTLVHVAGKTIYISTAKSPLRTQLLMAHVVSKILQVRGPQVLFW